MIAISLLLFSCDTVTKTPFPAADQPSSAEAKDLKGCDAEAIYYGIGRPRDAVLARKCAYVQRSEGDDLVFGGDGILMMIYATGEGTARNLDLAMRLACATAFADAEKEGRVEDLEARKKDPERAKKPFDICDHATSGFMSGHCAAHDERIAASLRNGRKDMALGRLPDSTALTKAADAYFTARADNEVDQSGTARAAFTIRERAALEESFVAGLELLVDDKAPKAGALPRADKALNEVYGKVMKLADFEYGTVTKDGIKKTQRAWIKYRDAWVALVKASNGAADTWSAWLTEERTKMLAEFLNP